MKRLLALAVTLASGMVLSAVAQSPAPAAPAAARSSASAAPAGPAKVGIIQFQAAISQTNEFQRNVADLEKKFDPKRQQLKTLADEIDTLTKQLQTQGPTLTEAARASRAGAIDTKKKQLDRDLQDAQTDYQQQIQDIFNGVASKFVEVLSTYAKQEGYTLVLDGPEGSQQQPVVLYAVDTADISKPVLDAYNVKSGVPAPPPQPAAAPGSQAAPKPAAPKAAPAAKPAAH